MIIAKEMNPKVLLASGLFCWAALLVQFGQGVDISFAGGTLIAAGSTATTTWAAGPAILAGLLLAKVVGLGIFAVSMFLVLIIKMEIILNVYRIIL